MVFRGDTLKILDLFSGIGGFSLGLESTGGFETVAFCEIDKYATRVLNRHWPGVPVYGDVRSLGLARLLGDDIPIPDIVCGGFPCQDISLAGKGAGLDGARSGLWFEMLRVIEETRPRFVIAENVAALRSRGLDTCLGGLASIGYDAEWHCIPASAVGAPHRRDRVWIVAYPKRGESFQRLNVDLLGGRPIEAEQARVGCGRVAQAVAYPHGESRDERWPDHAAEVTGRRDVDRSGIGADVADAEGGRLAIRQGVGSDGGQEFPPLMRGCGDSGFWVTEPDVGGTIDGFSAWLDRNVMASIQAHELLSAYGTDTQTGPGDILRALRGATIETNVLGEARGPVGLSPQAVLLAYLRQLETRAFDEARVLLACAKAPEGGVRGLRPREESSRAPYGPKPRKQRAGEYPDSVQTLSRLLAYHAEKAWVSYRRENARTVLPGWRDGWEDGFARVAEGVPARVDRLRCLGNAVVPQIPEMIGRAILESLV